MKGFSIKDRAKLSLSFRMCNDYQFDIICNLVDKEKLRRRKKALKNVKS